jgi:hypothetical protein
MLRPRRSRAPLTAEGTAGRQAACRRTGKGTAAGRPSPSSPSPSACTGTDVSGAASACLVIVAVGAVGPSGMAPAREPVVVAVVSAHRSPRPWRCGRMYSVSAPLALAHPHLHHNPYQHQSQNHRDRRGWLDRSGSTCVRGDEHGGECGRSSPTCSLSY